MLNYVLILSNRKKTARKARSNSMIYKLFHLERLFLFNKPFIVGENFFWSFNFLNNRFRRFRLPHLHLHPLPLEHWLTRMQDIFLKAYLKKIRIIPRFFVTNLCQNILWHQNRMRIHIAVCKWVNCWYYFFLFYAYRIMEAIFTSLIFRLSQKIWSVGYILEKSSSVADQTFLTASKAQRS